MMRFRVDHIRNMFAGIIMFIIFVASIVGFGFNVYAADISETDFPDEINLYFFNYVNTTRVQVDIPDEYPQSYNLPSISGVSYKIKSAYYSELTDDNVVRPIKQYYYNNGGLNVSISTERLDEYIAAGYPIQCRCKSGENIVTASWRTGTGERKTKEISVHTIDYSNIFIEQYLGNLLTEYRKTCSTDTEIVEAFNQYVIDEFEYKKEYQTTAGMIYYGGGDCWAYSHLYHDFLKLLGVRCYVRDAKNDPGAASGHMNTIGEIDGKIYKFDEGWMNYEASGFTITKDICVQYDGFSGEATVPEGVKTMGYGSRGVFGYTPDDVKVEVLNLPSTFTDYLSYAFNGRDLTEINVSLDNNKFASKDGVMYSKDMTQLVLFPVCKDIDTYVFPDEVSTLGKSCFGTKVIRKLEIPNTVDNIAQGAFANIIRALILPESNITLEEKAINNVSTNVFAKGMKAELAEGWINSKCMLYCLEGSDYEEYAKSHDMNYVTCELDEMDNSGIPIYSAEVTGLDGDFYRDSVNGVTPDIEVRVNDVLLKKDIDYTLVYSNTKNEGIASVKITGKGRYYGEITKNYTIKCIEVDSPVIEIDTNQAPLKADAEEWVKEHVTITFDNYVMEYGKDYSYSEAQSKFDTEGYAGYLAVVYKDRYKGKSYCIDLLHQLLPQLKDQEYTGEPICPNITIIGVMNTCYDVFYENNIEVGTATYTIKGKNGYFGEYTDTFEIYESASKEPVDISTATIRCSGEPEYNDEDSWIQNNLHVTVKGKELIFETDFTKSAINYSGRNVSSISLKGKGNYTGMLEIVNLSTHSISGVSSSYVINGEVKPVPKIYHQGSYMVKDVDFSVEYSNTDCPGAATMLVKGIGKNIGSITYSYELIASGGSEDENDQSDDEEKGPASQEEVTTPETGSDDEEKGPTSQEEGTIPETGSDETENGPASQEKGVTADTGNDDAENGTASHEEGTAPETGSDDAKKGQTSHEEGKTPDTRSDDVKNNITPKENGKKSGSQDDGTGYTTTPGDKKAAITKGEDNEDNEDIVIGKGYIISYNKSIYKVVKAGKQYEVEFVKPSKKSVKKVTISNKIVLPNGENASVVGIAKNAFKGCSKLKKIIVKSKGLRYVRKKALKGINKKAILVFPKSRYNTYKKMFKGKGQKKTVKYRS